MGSKIHSVSAKATPARKGNTHHVWANRISNIRSPKRNQGVPGVPRCGRGWKLQKEESPQKQAPMSPSGTDRHSPTLTPARRADARRPIFRQNRWARTIELRKSRVTARKCLSSCLPLIRSSLRGPTTFQTAVTVRKAMGIKFIVKPRPVDGWPYRKGEKGALEWSRARQLTDSKRFEKTCEQAQECESVQSGDRKTGPIDRVASKKSQQIVPHVQISRCSVENTKQTEGGCAKASHGHEQAQAKLAVIPPRPTNYR